MLSAQPVVAQVDFTGLWRPLARNEDGSGMVGDTAGVPVSAASQAPAAGRQTPVLFASAEQSGPVPGHESTRSQTPADGRQAVVAGSNASAGQSFATPSVAEYWHIGDTMMRFASSSPRSLMGEKRALAMSCFPYQGMSSTT